MKRDVVAALGLMLLVCGLFIRNCGQHFTQEGWKQRAFEAEARVRELEARPCMTFTRHSNTMCQRRDGGVYLCGGECEPLPHTCFRLDGGQFSWAPGCPQ